MNAAEALHTLRVRQGAPSEEDVPDAWLTDGLAAARRLYAAHSGPRRLLAFGGTQDVGAYEVPADDVAAVVDVFWNVAGRLEPDPFDAESVLFQTQVDVGAGLSLWESPSLLHIFFAKARALRERFRGVWEAAPAATGGKVEVHLAPPVATTGDKVYVLYRRAVPDVNRVPDGDLEAFLAAAMAHVYEVRAARLSVVTRVSHGGASMEFGGEAFARMAEGQRRRFLALAAAPSGPVR